MKAFLYTSLDCSGSEMGSRARAGTPATPLDGKKHRAISAQRLLLSAKINSGGKKRNGI